MPFPQDVVNRALIKAKHCCEACKRPVFASGKNRLRFHIHSSTTLHGVQCKDDPNYFVVTSAPDGHERMDNRRLPATMFAAYALGRFYDGFCLCTDCHKAIHDKERELAKNYKEKRRIKNVFVGIDDATFTSDRLGRKNSVISLLQDLTLEFVACGGKWASGT